MDNILKTIFGFLAFAGVCILIANIINPPIPKSPVDVISVQKKSEAESTYSETESESNPAQNEAQSMPVQDNANIPSPASTSGGTIIDSTNFGQPMMDPQPVMQLQNSTNPPTPPAQPQTNAMRDADGSISSDQSTTEPTAN